MTCTKQHRASAPPGLLPTLAATCAGNALEWYDLVVYAFFARYISQTFFPAADPSVALLLTFGSFGASFLVRPLGAVVLGAYADRHGRKKALLLTIGLMMLGTLMILLMPGYQQIGLLAPLLVLLARLIQGFSAGGEFGSSTAFLVEHFPARRVFIASWQIATQGASTVLAAGAGWLMTAWLTEPQLYAWGWRVPFIFGLLLGPVGLWMRRNIQEPPGFVTPGAGHSPLKLLMLQHKARLLLATGLIVLPTGINYMINFVPTYAMENLHLPGSVSFAATLSAGVVLTLLTPLVGMLAERVGRVPLMAAAVLALLISLWPAFWLLTHRPSSATLLLVVCWLAVTQSFYFACVPSALADLFPIRIRTSGMSIGYNVAVTLFGGFAPMICTLLIALTGSLLAPAYYLLMLAPLSAAALWCSRSALAER
ncbi:MFS transporter [Erwinia sp. E602]|uniref:MFS transporter n=1 Tax=unclassified Erwinia TaxID=2622719 RepID=UPI000C78CB5D|nr:MULTISPECIES: MFS transporter [unclassified Erwinia]PLV56448.1 membrane protein [Erwinia sp. B116]QUG75740.1 MFS transporter [Erwinia sp. E602]